MCGQPSRHADSPPEIWPEVRLARLLGTRGNRGYGAPGETRSATTQIFRFVVLSVNIWYSDVIMTLSELVESWIPFEDDEVGWICAREVAKKADCPLPSATSALATLCRFREDIERQYFVSGDVKRPVWHYRKRKNRYIEQVQG